MIKVLAYDIGFEIAAFCVTIGCLAYMLTRPSSLGRRQRHLFNSLLICLAIMTCIDLVYHVLLSGFHKQYFVLQVIGMELFLMMEMLTGYLYAQYIYCVNGTAIARKRKASRLYRLPLYAGWIAVLTSPLTGWLFSLSDNSIQKGPYYLSVYLVTMLYLVSGFAVFMLQHEDMTRKAQVTVCAAFLINISGYVMQYTIPSLLVEMFFNAMSLFFMMRFIECDETLIDQSTGLGNARALKIRVNQHMRLHRTVRVISMRAASLNFVNSLLSAEEQADLSNQIAVWVRSELTQYCLAFHYSDDRLVFLLDDPSEEAQNQFIDLLWQKSQRAWPVGRRRVSLSSTVLSILMPDPFCGSYSDFEALMNEENYQPQQGLRILGESEKAELKQKREIAGCIRRVLDRDQIQVYYQPIWDKDTDSIIACEALMRVHDDKLGWVRPDKIVEVAERNGTMAALDRTVLEKVCRFLAEKKPEQYGLRYVEVNLSMREMLAPDLAETYRQILEKYQVPIEKINLEFTETISDRESQVYESAKKKLKDIGFSFSLDDFGTEFSNIYRLFTNDFTNVKLDKSLLWNAEKDPNARKLLAHMLKMLRMMGINALQEGVETEAQKDFVTANGCNLIQGYYFSKALPEDEFLKYIQDFNGHHVQKTA